MRLAVALYCGHFADTVVMYGCFETLCWWGRRIWCISMVYLLVVYVHINVTEYGNALKHNLVQSVISSTG